jgi:hypothetical protein
MRLTALLALVLVLSLAAACGDDDDSTPTGSPDNLTPAGTKDETPTPPSGNGGVAPDPSDPVLDEQLTELTAGDLEQTIQPGESWELDVVAITQEATDEEPVCTNFAFDFTWQVQDPYPPDGVDLRWNLTREASTIEVSSGPAGEQTVGCGLLEGTNAGSAPFTVALRYRVGAIQ